MNDNLKNLWNTLKKSGYNPPDFDAFAKDMQDEGNLKRVHETLKREGYTPPQFETFKADMGYKVAAPAAVAPAATQKTTPIQPVAQPGQGAKPTKPISMPKPKPGDYEVMQSNVAADTMPIDSLKPLGSGKGYQTRHQPTADELQRQKNEKATREQVAQMSNRIDNLLDTRRAEATGMRIQGMEDAKKGGFFSSLGKALASTAGAGDVVDMQGQARQQQQYGDETTQEGYKKGQAIRQLEAARTTIRDAQRLIAEADHNAQEGTLKKWLESSFAGGAVRGFGKKLFDADNFDMGATDVVKSLGLMKALKKADKGEKLTEEEQIMLDSKALELATNAYFGSYVGRGYKAGQVTAESIPFMIEMCINPASATGTSAQSMLTRYALKKYGKDYLKKNAVKYLMGKGTARVAGDLAGAAAMTATTGSMRVMADTADRMNGQVKFDSDERGNIVYSGHEQGDSLGTAFAKAYASTTIENYSEMFGEYFAPITSAVGGVASKALNKVHLGAVNDFIEGVAANDLAKVVGDFEKHSKWSGSISEYAEEVAGSIMNALVVGDQTFDTDEDTGVFNLDNNIDTFLGVALMGGALSAVKTVGYRSPKHQARKAMEKADKDASAIFANQDLWGSYRNTIAFGNDEEKKQAVAAALANNDLTQEQKKAVLDYAAKVEAYKGMSKVDESHKKEGAGTPEVDAEQSYENGYTLEDAEEKQDASMMYENMRTKMEESAFNQDFIDALDNDPVGALRQMLQSNGITDEEKQLALDYVNAKATYDGMIDKVRDDIEGQVEASDKEIDSRTNKQSGNIVSVKLKNDQEAYVVDGVIAMTDDGTAVDIQNSSESILIRDKETGKIEFTSPSNILSADAPIDANEEKQKAADAIRDAVAQQASDEIDGTLAFQPNDQYNLLDGNGNPITATIVQDNGDGTVMASFNGSEAQPVAKETIQQFADNAKQARLAQFEAEKQAQQQAETPEPVNGYGLNDEFMLNIDGKLVRGSIEQMPDEEGKFGVWTEDAVNGSKYHKFTADELDVMTGKVEAPVQEAAPIAEGEAPAQAEQAQEAMPMNADETDYDYATAGTQRTSQFLSNEEESGLTSDEADDFISDKIKEAEKALNKANSKKSKNTNLLQRKRENEAIKGEIDAAQTNLDFWNNVKNERENIKSAPAVGEESAENAAAPVVSSAPEVETPVAPVSNKAEEKATGKTEKEAKEVKEPVEAPKTERKKQPKPTPAQAAENARSYKVGDEMQNNVANDGSYITIDSNDGNYVGVTFHNADGTTKSSQNMPKNVFDTLVRNGQYQPTEAKKNDYTDTNKKSGLIIMDGGDKLSEEQKAMYDAIGKQLGIKIIVRELPKKVNGRSVGRNTIEINSTTAANTKKTMQTIVGHEMTHSIKKSLRDVEAFQEAWEGLVSMVKTAMGEQAYKAEFDKLRKAYDDFYDKLRKEGNEVTNLSDADIDEELVCNFIGNNVLTDEQFMQNLINHVAENGGDVNSVIDSMRKLIDKFLEILKSIVNPSSEVEEMQKALESAKDIWAKMYELRALQEQGTHSETDAATQDKNSIDATKYNINTEEDLLKAINEFASSTEAKDLGWAKESVKEIAEETNALFNMIHAGISGDVNYDEFAKKNPTLKVDWRDGVEKPVVTWVRGNIEYKYDMSADTFCINNEGLETVLASPVMADLMVHMADFNEFTSDDYLRLYETLRDLGFVVPCKGCFDAAARFKMLPSVAQEFVRLVNEEIDKRNKNRKAYDAKVKKMGGKKEKTINGLPASADTKEDAIMIAVVGDNLTKHITWTQLMSAEGQTQALADWGGIFRAWQKTGAGRPKDKLMPEPYTGQIMQSTTTIIGPLGDKTPSFRDIEVNVGTGLRRNSHSEYRPVLVVDEMQFVRDCWLKGLCVFKYMKELDDVRLFGKMGIKFNMSGFAAFVKGGVAAGLDENGDFAFAEESVGGREFPYIGKDGKTHYDGKKGFEEALKYVNENVSISNVAFSIPHLIKLMTNVPTPSDLRGIFGSLIPFHSSGATTKALAMQGLGLARANGVGHEFMEEALTDYDKGVTNFEDVQNDRFGKGWRILAGKKAGEDVKEGHKIEFANGTIYRNDELGITLYSSPDTFKNNGGDVDVISDVQYKKNGEPRMSKGQVVRKRKVSGHFITFDSEDNKIAHEFNVDYNDKVRELGGKYAYKEAADYYIDLLRNNGFYPRFDFAVPEDVFLKMCSDAKVDPKHPKLGWKGEGNSWSPCDAESYYSLFCDYGMTDPKTGELAPHKPVLDGQKDADAFEKALPENYLDVIKDGIDRYSTRKAAEDSQFNEAIIEYCNRSIADGKMSKAKAKKILAKHGIDMDVKYSIDIDAVENNQDMTTSVGNNGNIESNTKENASTNNNNVDRSSNNSGNSVTLRTNSQQWLSEEQRNKSMQAHANDKDMARKELSFLSDASKAGVKFTYEELMQVPEIQEAQRTLDEKKGHLEISKKQTSDLAHKLLDEEHGAFTHKEKDANGKSVEIFDGEVKQERKAFIVIGRPAGGKSSVFANPLSRDNGARIIDSDTVKPWLDGYDDGNGAGYVQIASAEVADEALAIAMAHGDNIVLPKIGGPSVLRMALDMFEQGYEVQMYYNDVPAEASYTRSMARFAETGRYLDMDYLYKIQDKPLTTFTVASKGYEAILEYLAQKEISDNQKEGTNKTYYQELYKAYKDGKEESQRTNTVSSGRYGQGYQDESESTGIGEEDTRPRTGQNIFSKLEWKDNDVKLGQKPELVWNSESDASLPTPNDRRAAKVIKSDNFINFFGDWQNNPEGASKVVDEQGKPLVMSHATPYYGFTVFNTKSNKHGETVVGSHFGTEESAKDRLSGMGNRSDKTQDGTYHVYLNIRNPWECTDWFDKNDSRIIRDLAKLANENKDNARVQHYWDLVKTWESWAKDYTDEQLAKGDFVKDIPGLESYDTDDLSDLHKFVKGMITAAGYDGIKYQNETEGSGYSWVAFKPNQIKSAEVEGEMQNNGEFNPDNDDIRYSLADDTEIEDKAVKEFGETNDWNETGWLTINGKKLDFSEKNNGGEPGERWKDHREIQAVVGSDEQQWKALRDFEQHGGIRISTAKGSEFGGIEMSVKPTEKQFKQLGSYIRKCGGNIYIDFMDNTYNVEHTVSYDGATAPRIVSDIRKFYDEGLKPLGNVKYSLNEDYAETYDDDVRYSLLTDDTAETEDDRKALEAIKNGETKTVYRSMQVVEIDGKRYALPPMASKIDGKWVMGVLINDDGTLEPQLLKADEHPELADNDGKFLLDKGNGKSLKAAYNPYWHTSPKTENSSGMLNDQFSEAQSRSNLITVEGVVPTFELTSGYKAEKAKDDVGQKDWKAGVIQGQLSGTRTVILSRYFQGVRVVPDAEVAQNIYNDINGNVDYMPTNVVPPAVRAELEKLGVKFVKTDNMNQLLEGEHVGDRFTWWYGKNPEANRRSAFRERAVAEYMHLADWLEKEGRTGQISPKYVENTDKKIDKSIELQKAKDAQKAEKEAIKAQKKANAQAKKSKKASKKSDTRERQAAPSVTYTKDTSRNYSRKKQAEYAQRQERRARQKIDDFCKKLHIDGIVTLLDDGSGLKGKKARAKGWFDVRTGKITIVLGNHSSLGDVMKTILHESVAHYGLRKLFGKNFDTFLDNTFQNADEDIRRQIVELAKKHKWNFRVATEEYLAKLAEDTEFDTAEHQEWWDKVKFFFYDMMKKLGIDGFKSDIIITDNELKYLLWRSYNGLTDPTRFKSYVGMAEDVVMQNELGVGNYEENTGNGEWSAAEDTLFRDADDADAEEPKTMSEQILEGLMQLSQRNADNVQLKLDILKSISAQISKLKKAARAQREYDKTTVDEMVGIARIMLANGYIDTMTAPEVKRLLLDIRNATGKEDIAKYAREMIKHLTDIQVKQAMKVFGSVIKIRGSKVNASGVEVQGTLDVKGQMFINAFRGAFGLSEQAIQDRIDDLTDKMADPNQMISENAAIERGALTLALSYVQDVKMSLEEEKQLKQELKDAKEAKKAGTMDKDAYKQFVEATENALLQNKLERIEALRQLTGKLAGALRGSIQDAKEFREQEKQRVRNIQHYANSDMEGRPTDEHHKEDWKQKFMNNSFIRFFLKPLGTFDQMLRMFGNKNVNGEGYLYNHFMRKWLNASHNEFKKFKAATDVLDKKVSEVFGKKMRWSDLYALERKMGTVTVEFYDGGVKKSHELTQGNLLYMWMVNKMDDGAMKLAKMGITEADMKAVENMLDPRFKELANWIQEEFLVNKRNEYNEVHERLFGAPMANIDNYFPLKVLANARTENIEIADNNGSNALVSTVTGSVIKRRRNSLALDITGADAFSVVIEHIQQMEHWAAYAEFNKDINTLLSYKHFRNQVMNMSSIYGGGKKLWDNFKDVCKIASGVYRPISTSDSADKTFLNAAKGITAAKISFRIFTALKQFLSSPAYLAEANVINIGKSLATPWLSWNWAMQELPTFQKRWQSRQAGDSRLMDTDMDWRFWHNRMVETISRWGMSPNAFVDAMTVSIGAKAIYDTKLAQYLKDGYSQTKAEQKAKEDAAVLVNETQQSSEAAFMSTIQLDRTVASVALTVFRNSSMGYQRQFVDAIRSLKKMMTPGNRAKSIEFMTKQMVRDGLDDAQAKRAATRVYNHAAFRHLARVAVFGYIMQFAWNLGPYMAYLLMGDDDDEKDKMLEDAAQHALFGGLEGLSAGSILSEIANMMASGASFRNYEFNLLPMMADIQSIVTHFENDKVAGSNEIINLLLQSAIGMNPQTATDAAVAIYDACKGDPKTSKEATILIMRLLSMPKGQIEKIYIDELGLKGNEVKNYTVAQMAERYARYKKNAGAPLTQVFYSDPVEEAVVGKYIEKFEKKVKERVKASTGNKELDDAYQKYEEKFKEADKTYQSIMDLRTRDQSEFMRRMQDFSTTEEFRDYSLFKGYKNAIDNLFKTALNIQDPQKRDELLRQADEYKGKLVTELDKLHQ